MPVQASVASPALLAAAGMFSPLLREMRETAYQFRNWYHFRWLSGDDVPQSLVHNMDRVAWVLKEETPSWCFGLGGQSHSAWSI